jgi:hypothetical protein
MPPVITVPPAILFETLYFSLAGSTSSEGGLREPSKRAQSI